jgi:hypothetical protein
MNRRARASCVPFRRVAPCKKVSSIKDISRGYYIKGAGLFLWAPYYIVIVFNDVFDVFSFFFLLVYWDFFGGKE